MAWKVYTLLILAVFPDAVFSGTPTACKQVAPTNSGGCVFMTDVGDIDLSPLDSKSGPKFTNILGQASDTFSYNTCTDYTDTSSVGACVSVSACQSMYNGAYYNPIGNHASAKCMSDADGVFIQYSLTYTTDNVLRTTKVYLVCDPTKDGDFVAKSEGINTYSFTLSSKHVCGGSGGGGLSFGSILCIILFVVVMVYLIFGSLFMYYQRGARGKEIIPNYTFWKDFPILVKDGGVYVVQKIKGTGGTYNEI